MEPPVLVGLEIHQQLKTGSKLFCRCSGVREPGREERFVRRLRPVKSEMGRYDEAALFEGLLKRDVMYRADANNSCMVEWDEEPPREVDHASKMAALTVAAALESSVFEEIYPMRKTVIDGSNTGGFQRTMLVSQGGTLRTGDLTVEVQSICLEEDSARSLGEEDGMRVYALDRLGVPLVEIALAPMPGDPKEVRRAAEGLGRLLRSTRRVARGIGTIRQDVNVSVRGGGGIVEVKGVQYLDQLERVVEREADRQDGLLEIRDALLDRGPPLPKIDALDVTDVMGGCGSDAVRGALARKDVLHLIPLRGYAGMLGHEPRPGVRLGRELAQLVKPFGVGGIFHSDELPGYGIGPDAVTELYGRMGGDPDADAFVLVAAPLDLMYGLRRAIVRRVIQASKGVPAETRMALQSGRTVFMRPRPGSARMYPETDIPPVIVTGREMEEARGLVPPPWAEQVREYSARYGISAQLAEQLLDSDRLETFRELAARRNVPPAFAASILCYTMKEMRREGLDVRALDDDTLREAFGLLGRDEISKEGVEMVLRDVASGNSDTVAEAVENTGVGRVPDAEVSGILDEIVSQNRPMISKMGERAVGPLMGKAMSKLRGKAPGELVSRMLAEKIRDA